MRVRRGGIAIACALTALLGGAGGAGAATPTPDQARELGRQAYDYGFPLLEFLRVRREQTSVRCPDGKGDAPVNSLTNARRFATPEDRTVVAPNTDTLYSIAHLDLSRGPLLLSHPNMGRRYFSFELVDPFTNVVAYVGTRTTGSRARRVAIVWRGHGGHVHKGVRVIRSSYRRLWVIGRTLARGPADLRRARRLMARYRLTNAAGGARRFPRHCRPGTPKTYPTPTDGAAFLGALDGGLAPNPPPVRDNPFLRTLAAVGVGPGLSPASAGLPADVLAALYAGATAQAAALPLSAKLQAFQGAAANGGWYQVDPHIGRYGTDHSLRALVASVGLGANTRAEAIYPAGITDSAGRLYDGAHSYRLVFALGQQPPARYFWSLTMYDVDGFLVDNPVKRYAIGPTHRPLVRRPNGSIVVAIQHDPPSEAGVNWLPAPTGGFRLNLRLYGPSRRALSGAWQPPPVIRTDG